jgi:hypothetical protein
VCDDHVADEASTAVAPELSRRRFVHAAGIAAATVAFLRRFPRLPLRSSARDVTADGTAAYSMAMHVHSSFSEQSGSMDSQLFQATANSVDVLWWTDHDARMDGTGYSQTVHFTSLTGESTPPGRAPWVWTRTEAGPVSSNSGGGIVADPCSPNDPVAKGSLHLAAKSRTTAAARFGYYANSRPAGWNYHDNLTGQSLTVDLLLDSDWTRGYLELLIASSYHAPAAGRPGGDYTLSYRFVNGDGPATVVAEGLQGVITVPIPRQNEQSPWSTITIVPSADISTLWPDLDYRDFALWGLTLSAVSTGDLVSGYFDYLRFDRQMSGEAFLLQQMDMETVLASRYPAVTQRQGLEVSLLLPHVNWFGGAVAIPDYGTATPKDYSNYLQETVIPEIHAAGGLVSYNHPFGYGDPAELPAAQQNELLKQIAALLLPGPGSPAALGADLIEVGYPLRQGVDLAHHLALWDVMSRNGVFLTGNGTNDDHFGQNWSGIHNNWFTSTWAASTAEADLLASLAAGRAWCGSLSRYRGSLDLLVDGSCPMGSVSVSAVSSRELAATATGIPAGGSLQILQGTVDYAGVGAPTANTAVIGAYSATDLAGGSVTRSIDTTEPSFVRTQVIDAAGSLVGVSNPVWLLNSPPADGVPGPRAA